MAGSFEGYEKEARHIMGMENERGFQFGK